MPERSLIEAANETPDIETQRYVPFTEDDYHRLGIVRRHIWIDRYGRETVISYSNAREPIYYNSRHRGISPLRSLWGWVVGRAKLRSSVAAS